MQGDGFPRNRLSELAIPHGKPCGRSSLAPRSCGEAGGPPASLELHRSHHGNHMDQPTVASPFSKER